MQFKKILPLPFFITALTLSSSVLAKDVHILCPAIDAIQFNPPIHYKWANYEPTGYAQILSDNFPSFTMTSGSDGNTVKYFSGASYIEDAFICNYWDGKKNAFVLVDNGDLAPKFKDCNFKRGDKYECDGNTVDKCELICSGS